MLFLIPLVWLAAAVLAVAACRSASLVDRAEDELSDAGAESLWAPPAVRGPSRPACEGRVHGGRRVGVRARR